MPRFDQKIMIYLSVILLYLFQVFKSHGITGRILPYLTSQHLTRTLGMKLTSAMNLLQEIDRITTLRSAQMTPHMMNQETLSKIIR